MNIERQRRKITHRLENAPDNDHRIYLQYVLNEFDRSIEAGMPRPAKEFLGMYFEEFDIQ